jgi:uncharacterized membrane protein YfcA
MTSDPASLAMVALGCLVIGSLIGLTGIGGVALVPLLTVVGGMPVHQAVPVSLLSFLATGVVGVLIHGRRSVLAPAHAASIAAGAGMGSLAGSALFALVPARVPEALLAILMLGSGLFDLSRARDSVGAGAGSPAGLGAMAAIAGIGSALTGTGGPVILVPLLLAAGIAPIAAVAMGQIVQIPVALFATAGNAVLGGVDWRAAALIGAVLSCGAVAGARLAHRLASTRLRRAVAMALLGCGLLYGGALLGRVHSG